MRPPRRRDDLTATVLPDRIAIDAPRYRASIARSGYVSGVVGGSLLDKATGARDLGFGLDVADFLLEPADPKVPIPEGQYEFGPEDLVHGDIPKRYVEGPQICTQAKRLEPVVTRRRDFVAVTQSYRWTTPYAPRDSAGSLWEQTLIFPRGERYFLACDRVTVANASPALSLRIDLPGHIKHDRGAGFEHVYLSYADPSYLPSTEFADDFAPDARYLYTRGADVPTRFVRAYQVDLGPGKPEGPWLAGITLNPSDVAQAWCHQRGYVCMIQEVGGRAVEPGDHFGAAYAIGWFDDVAEMHAVADRYAGVTGFALDGTETFQALKA